ncbi:MAG TPA: DUF1761 domain-containing protein [Planctomycetota bacterium]|nr:DUF1761 domain-containing protein [Planctomycetota bacterium]
MNHLAVIAAALSSFLLGGLWYSPKLFGNAWNRAAGRPEKCEGGRHPAKVFAVAIVLSVVAAYVFAAFLGARPEFGAAVRGGVLVGAGVVAASFGINYAFADRSTVLWLIDGGYHAVQFTLFGVVLGLWH